MYLRDVARVELGAETYNTFAQKGNVNSASVLIYQSPGANALDVAERVREAVNQISESFPKGMRQYIPFDTTIFASPAITEVYKTLLEAGVLVLTVVGTVWWYRQVPTGFLPTEDQGYLITAVQLPDAASQERTKSGVQQIKSNP